MYLSAFQKDIVRKISNEEIKTIKDFLLVFKLIETVPVKLEDPNIYGDKIIKEGKSDFEMNEIHYKVIDKEDCHNKLIDFKKVLNLLLKAELIEIENSADLGFGFAYTEDRPAQIISIIDFFQRGFIIPYNEIRNFAKDFHTPQERNHSRQLWVPIIVAIATVVLSSLFNYFIYTKEREVYIKNVNAFKDSLYVKILNDMEVSLSRNRTGLDSINSKKEKISSDKTLERK